MQIQRLITSAIAVIIFTAPIIGHSANPAPPKISPAMPMKTKPAVQLKKQPAAPALNEKLQLKPGTIAKNGCPDPEVALKVGWPSRNPNGTYNFKLLATVVNRGSATFVSKRNQQLMTISEGNHALLSEEWKSRYYDKVEYATGQGGSHVYTILNWNPGSEFLADYSAQITYDPDIRIDSNPANDDCRNGNNSARLTVAEVRRTLEALP